MSSRNIQLTYYDATNQPVKTFLSNPKKHFDVLTYTGNGATNNITSLEFQPDLVWIKARSDTHHHTLHSVRGGTNKQLYSNLTNGRATDADSFPYIFSTLMDSHYEIIQQVMSNCKSQSFVAWCWKAGGASSSK